jgi:uncharacterized lipoprotein
MMRALVVASMLMLAACSGTDDLARGKGGTTFDVKGKTYNAVWNASITALTSSGLAIIESNKSDGLIKAEKAAGMMTWGEVVGVFISPTKKSSIYHVQVQSLKRATYQITGQVWDKTIAERIKSELNR